jgi:hypothetical protein
VLGEGARWDARREELLRVQHYQVIRDCQGELIRWNSLVCSARVLEGIDSRSEFGGRTRWVFDPLRPLNLGRKEHCRCETYEPDHH